MGRFWRRLRGLLGTAIVWAGAYGLVGLVVGAVFWVSGATVLGWGGPGWITAWAKIGAMTGAISGGVFSIAVMALERRGDFSAITPFRFGAFGALTAGVVMAVLSLPEPLYGLVGAVLGFVCGSGSVVVARRALLPPAARGTRLVWHP